MKADLKASSSPKPNPNPVAEVCTGLATGTGDRSMERGGGGGARRVGTGGAAELGGKLVEKESSSNAKDGSSVAGMGTTEASNESAGAAGEGDGATDGDGMAEKARTWRSGSTVPKDVSVVSKAAGSACD